VLAAEGDAQKLLLECEELERARDWLAKLLGRQQLATVGVDDNQHASAGDAIVE
jgi:hypothetical protein